MYAFPPLLVALVVCLGQGFDRPPAETLAAVLSSLAFAGFIIFGIFLHPKVDAVFATLTLHFFIRLPQHLPGSLDLARLVLLLLAAAVALFFAIAPARFARVLLPAAVGLLLVLASRSAYVVLAANTRAWAASTGPVRSWIDDRIGSSPRTVGYLFVPGTSSYTSSIVLANTQFWNRSINSVLTLGSAPLCPLPLNALRLDEQTGSLVDEHDPGSAREPYLVTESALAIAGEAVASGGTPSAPLTIYRPALPLRVTSRTVGVYPDGWTGPNASYFVLVVSPEAGQDQDSPEQDRVDGPGCPRQGHRDYPPVGGLGRTVHPSAQADGSLQGPNQSAATTCPGASIQGRRPCGPDLLGCSIPVAGHPRPLGLQIAFSHVQGH